MEIASIKGDTVLLLYHPAEAAAEVGEQLSILEVANQGDGLVVQVISNDSLEYVGLQQEAIQKLLEERAANNLNVVVNREQGMGEMKNLKVARAKIRRRIAQGAWHPWDGWIPTRNVEIQPITAAGLMQHVVPAPAHAIRSIASFDGTPIRFDGARLNMVNVVAGVKGSGKSHTAKHLVLALSDAQVPCIIFDLNGEYTVLPNAQVLRWGDNFVPELAEVGYEMLSMVVRSIYPLPETSANAFEAGLPVAFAQRRQRCTQAAQPFTADIDFFLGYNWSGNQHVTGAIQERLRAVQRWRLFRTAQQAALAAEAAQRRQAGQPLLPQHQNLPITDIGDAYNHACGGRPLVFDLRTLTPGLRHALVKAVLQTIERICEEESSQQGQGRFPFVFFEEAHFYVNKDAILNIITRGRHIGMGSVFVTNTPQELPDAIFRQLDNLFLLALTHRDDIRSVSQNSFTDEDTIESFATRMPERHALIVGNVTERYPLVLKIDPLPAGLPPTGRTKSTWDRFAGAGAAPGAAQPAPPPAPVAPQP